MKDEILKEVQSVAESLLSSRGMELVDLQFRRERQGWVLRIYIDKEGGVDLNDCSLVSSQLGDLIEDQGIIDHSYILEVSSPGLNRPLKKRADFERFKGHRVKVKTRFPVKGTKVFRGQLLGLKDDLISILREGEGPIHIPLERVDVAQLEYEF
jgi:ribosome maturation factor RimP